MSDHFTIPHCYRPNASSQRQLAELGRHAESPFQAQELGNIERDGYYSRIFSTQEHYGTHLDAPAHFAAGAWTVDRDSGRAPGAAAGGPRRSHERRRQC